MTSPLAFSKEHDTESPAGVPGPALGSLGSMPGVNLMPPEIAERAALQQVKVAAVAAVVLSALAVGGLYYQAHSGVSSAQKNLADAQQQQTAVQQQVTKLQPVAAAYAQVTAAKAEVAEALGGEIRWSGKLDDLSLSIPANVWLTNMSVATSGSANGALASTGISTITFQGVATNRDDVAVWLESLARENGYANPYVSVTQETAVGSKVLVDFTSTVTVTDAALSGRYTSTSGS